MSLTIHHLRLSQSERIVWLCEELSDSIPDFRFDVVSYDRDPFAAVAPPDLRALHPAGTAPLMIDGTANPAIMLTETQAIMEYIIHVHGRGLFEIKPDDPAYTTYLTWYNFANGSMQPLLTKLGTLDLVFKHLERTQPLFASSEASISMEEAKAPIEARLWTFLTMLEDHLTNNTYLAGVSFSAADIMMNFSLTTMRGFYPINLERYPNILRYLNMICKRPAYRRAMERCNPGLPPLIHAVVETFDFPVLKSTSDG